MKTIKKFAFTMFALMAMTLTFSSCDALSDALSKEVEIEAPAIDFSIGGSTAAPMQKVAGATEEYVWLDKPAVDIKTKLEEELAKNNLTIDKVKTLYVSNSVINITTALTQNYNLGNVKIYFNGVVVAQGAGQVSAVVNHIAFTYATPYDLFARLSVGNVAIKVTSDQPKPNIKMDMKLINTYTSKISLL